MKYNRKIEKVIQITEGKRKFFVNRKKALRLLNELLDEILGKNDSEEICVIVSKEELNYLERFIQKLNGVKKLLLCSEDFALTGSFQKFEIDYKVILLLAEDANYFIRWKMMNALNVENGNTIIYYNDYFEKKGVFFVGNWSDKKRKRIKAYIRLAEIKAVRSFMRERFPKFIQYRSPDYKEIFVYQKLYHITNSIVWKNYYCKKVIVAYLSSRDFKNALKWICIAKKTVDEEKFEYVENRVDILLEHISKSLKKKRTKNIVINWIDALKYKELVTKEECRYLFKKKGKKNVVFFENAYTVMPWTHWTMYTMFSKKLPIESGMHKFKKIDKSMLLMRVLKNNKFRFKYIGTPIHYKRFCRKNYVKYKNVPNGSLPCSYILFDALERIIKERKNNCILVHSLLETHSPFWNGLDNIKNLKWGNYTENEQDLGLKYVVEQIEWYDKYYELCNITKIYMSDHGKDTRVLSDDRTHIVFIIEGMNIESENVEGLFSIIDFSDIIENVIHNKKKYSQFEREYINLQSLDYYNEYLVKKALENNLEKYEWMQQRGIITHTKKYLLFADGEELVYALGDEENNVINRIEQEELDELRRCAGKDFIDISKDDFFVNARLLYQALERGGLT